MKHLQMELDDRLHGKIYSPLNHHNCRYLDKDLDLYLWKELFHHLSLSLKTTQYIIRTQLDD